jgi:hypothetical protein
MADVKNGCKVWLVAGMKKRRRRMLEMDEYLKTSLAYLLALESSIALSTSVELAVVEVTMQVCERLSRAATSMLEKSSYQP